MNPIVKNVTETPGCTSAYWKFDFRHLFCIVYGPAKQHYFCIRVGCLVNPFTPTFCFQSKLLSANCFKSDWLVTIPHPPRTCVDCEHSLFCCKICGRNAICERPVVSWAPVTKLPACGYRVRSTVFRANKRVLAV